MSTKKEKVYEHPLVTFYELQSEGPVMSGSQTESLDENPGTWG